MKSKRQKGGAALEFAIALPILLLLVLGIFEFGLILYNQQVITNACREGARAGIVKDGPYGPAVEPGKIDEIVTSYCSTHLITSGGTTIPTVTSTAPCPSGSYSGTDLTVTVNFHYNYFALPTFVAGLVGGTDLTAISVMRCE